MSNDLESTIPPPSPPPANLVAALFAAFAAVPTTTTSSPTAATVLEVAISSLETVVDLTTMPEEAPMPVCGMVNNLAAIVDQLRDVAAWEPSQAAADAALDIMVAVRAVIAVAGPPAHPHVTVRGMCCILEGLIERMRGCV